MINGRVVLCALIASLLSTITFASNTAARSEDRTRIASRPGSPDAAASAQPLRVMSFNLRVPFRLDLHNYWTHRKDLVVQTIRQFDPDVLGTQECVDDQARHLFRNLEGYGFVGAGRDDGDTGGEMCAIFFRLDRFRRVDSGHFWLSETPDRVGSKGWDAGWRRVCSWVKLESLRDGRRFVVFNTHFDVFGEEARYRSAILLREKIDEIAAGLPAIITGDFNDREGSTPYRTLVEGRHPADETLVDTYREIHPVRKEHEGTRHGFGGSTDGERIDWILTTLGFDTLAADIDRTHRGNRYPSDHFPVTAVLRWDSVEARARLTAAEAARNDG